MMTSGFHHVAIRAFDFDKTIKFYMEGLGFKEYIRWGEGDKRGIMLDTGNNNYLEVFAGEKAVQKPEGAYIHLAFRTGNCQQALEQAVAAGAEVTMPVTEIEIPSNPVTKATIAFCKGPDGEVIEFFQNR